MGLIDSHAHLTDEPLWEDIDGVLSRSFASKVETIVNICTNQSSLERGLLLKKQRPCIYHVAATTPHDVAKEGEEFFPLVEQAAKEKKLVGIGETGLDYHYTHSPKELQKKWLIAYFHLAKELDLPIVIHCREAFSDLFALADLHYKDRPLLLHCFTGSFEEAEMALCRGWKISLSGIITFKNSLSLRETAKKLPLEHLLLETDAPYLSPQSRRGKINEPSFLNETALCLAELKSLSFEEIAFATAHNTLRFFRLQTLV